jgi:hypothetical protein
MEISMKEVHVTPRREEKGGGWTVVAGPFRTQEQAIDAARVLATVMETELTVHGEDGQIREKDSHGNDPRRSKG